jgi:hypothetical protein
MRRAESPSMQGFSVPVGTMIKGLPPAGQRRNDFLKKKETAK